VHQPRHIQHSEFDRPLDGVRILDLTRLLPGAYATLLLADLGADVIKLEDPRGGDHGRRMPPLANGTSVYFQVLNRNKRSVTLDLRSDEAGAVLDALLATCDVLVDSFRPRTAARLGLDPAALRARHPRLVCASISGFGHTGPYVDRAAHDINYEALVGLLTPANREVTNDQRQSDERSNDACKSNAFHEQPVSPPACEPRVPRLLVGDIGAAMNAASGILAALFQRERTGRGAFVDISIHEAALSWMLFPGAPALVSGAHDRREEVSLTGDAACYNVYATADDRYLALGALEPKFWTAFCERIGRPDLGSTQAAQGDERARVLDEVRAVMRTRTRDEWLAVFADADVCLTPVRTLDEALTDPHLMERGAIVRAGNVTHLAAHRTEIRPAPALGADTDDVLEEAGVGAAERARLRARRVL
jgi:alpha-methylacyl-CoA racemase